MFAASSPYAIAPQYDTKPAKTQTNNSKNADCTCFAISQDTIKIPHPIIERLQ